ncbi:MAG: PEGA domain-containing protein [Candidatus Eremiobacterota bacterium]
MINKLITGLILFLVLSCSRAFSQETGDIFVNSQPVGATVFLDGKKLGTTPLPVNKIPKGKHTLKIILKDQQEVIKEIDIVPGPTKPIHIVFQEREGGLVITSSPAGAKVFLDEVYVGKSPVNLKLVLSGKHTLNVTMEGYDTYSEKINIKSGEIENIKVTLKPEADENNPAENGKLTIRTLPPDADIYIDGNVTGRSPLIALSVTEGNHIIKAIKSGYESKTREIGIKKGEEKEVKITLNKAKKSFPFLYIITGIITILCILWLVKKVFIKTGLHGKDKIVGNYKITGKIADDSFFTIYRGVHCHTGQEVTIKIPLPYLAQDPVFIKYFQEEMEIWKGLNHPNIVTVYDYGSEKNLYIAMESVKSRRLDEIIPKNSPIDLKEAVDIIYQLTLALSYGQAKGVIHGDLKPSNILITETDHVKIDNYCICRDLYGYSINSIGVYKGQMQYMAPEKLEKKSMDFKTDLFSLGIIFYRLLTGELPFEGDTPNMILESHYYKKIIPVKTFNDSVPDRIQELILNMVQIDPAQRHKSPEQLMKLLKGIKDNL